MAKDSQPFSVQVGFYTFARYFVPGFYTAFWIVLYGIRLTHSTDIDTAAKLLSFLHANSAGLIPIIAAFGSFVGFILVGVDAYIKSMFSNPFVHYVNRYLLSSRFFPIPFFYFTDIHLMSHRFNRLGIKLIQEDKNSLEELKKMADSGSYEERCLLREFIADFFWSKLPQRIRNVLTERRESSSLFLTMAFSTLFLIMFQLLFYMYHILKDGVFVPDLVLLLLLGYFVFNLSSNIADRKMHDKDKAKVRKSTLIMSFAIIVAVSSILFLYIFEPLRWFAVLDSLFLYSYIALFLLLYWAAAFRYCHYALTYERWFHKVKSKIVKYSNEHYELFKELTDELIPKNQRTKKMSLILAILAVFFSILGIALLLTLVLNMSLWDEIKTGQKLAILITVISTFVFLIVVVALKSKEQNRTA